MSATQLGLVLGAGGSRGYGWHTGVLAALEEVTGRDLRTVGPMVGTSAGSYAVAYLRGGFSGADLFAAATGNQPVGVGLELLRRIGPTSQLDPWSRPALRSIAAASVVKEAVRRRSVPRFGAALAGLLPAGTVSGEPWLGPLRTLWTGRPWPVGLRVPAVRVRDGQRRVFDADSGVDLIDAVAASSAVPAVMAPIPIQGENYVDGSAWSPTSSDLLAADGLGLIVVSAPMSAPVQRAGLSLDGGLRAWASRHARTESERLARSGVRVLTLAPTEASRLVLAGRAGSVDERRARAAQAAYDQVTAHGAALRDAIE